MYETDNRVGKGAVNKRRISSQPLLPQQWKSGPAKKNAYEMYPFHSLGNDKIFHGYESLAQWITGHKQIVIDGYGGIFWKEVKQCLQTQLEAKGFSIHWIEVSHYLKSETAILQMVAPFLGTKE